MRWNAVAHAPAASREMQKHHEQSVTRDAGYSPGISLPMVLNGLYSVRAPRYRAVLVQTVIRSRKYPANYDAKRRGVQGLHNTRRPQSVTPHKPPAQPAFTRNIPFPTSVYARDTPLFAGATTGEG